MRKALALLCLAATSLAACEPQTEVATIAEMAYFVYDETPLAKPIWADSCFFVMSTRHDSLVASRMAPDGHKEWSQWLGPLIAKPEGHELSSTFCKATLDGNISFMVNFMDTVSSTGGEFMNLVNLSPEGALNWSLSAELPNDSAGNFFLTDVEVGGDYVVVLAAKEGTPSAQGVAGQISIFTQSGTLLQHNFSETFLERELLDFIFTQEGYPVLQTRQRGNLVASFYAAYLDLQANLVEELSSPESFVELHIQLETDDGLYLVGASQSGLNISYFLFELDAQGNLVRKVELASTLMIATYDLEVLDGELLLVGTESLRTPYQRDWSDVAQYAPANLVAMKFGATAEGSWAAYFRDGPKMIGGAVGIRPDGGYTILGTQMTHGLFENLFVLKLDRSGELLENAEDGGLFNQEPL